MMVLQSQHKTLGVQVVSVAVEPQDITLTRGMVVEAVDTPAVAAVLGMAVVALQVGDQPMCLGDSPLQQRVPTAVVALYK